MINSSSYHTSCRLVVRAVKQQDGKEDNISKNNPTSNRLVIN